jgi:hypothetical protein
MKIPSPGVWCFRWINAPRTRTELLIAVPSVHTHNCLDAMTTRWVTSRWRPIISKVTKWPDINFLPREKSAPTPARLTTFITPVRRFRHLQVAGVLFSLPACLLDRFMIDRSVSPQGAIGPASSSPQVANCDFFLFTSRVWRRFPAALIVLYGVDTTYELYGYGPASSKHIVDSLTRDSDLVPASLLIISNNYIKRDWPYEFR